MQISNEKELTDFLKGLENYAKYKFLKGCTMQVTIIEPTFETIKFQMDAGGTILEQKQLIQNGKIIIE